MNFLDAFRKIVDEQPDKVAIVDLDGARSTTYQELAAWSGRVAARLLEAGNVAGRAVLVCMDRRMEYLAAEIGIMMAGAAYVSLVSGRKGGMKMENASMLKFHADDIIMKEGGTYEEMYKIISGSVAVYMRYGEKEEHLIGIYSKSKCFGETHVLSGQPSVYTVVAYDEVLLMRITKDSLEEFIRNNPRNAIDIMQNMVHTNMLMQKNIDLLLDDIYEKQEINKRRTEEMKNKIKQYRMNGFNLLGV